MRKNMFSVARDTNTSLRYELVTELFSVIFNPDEIPYYVSDEACVDDVYLGDEQNLIDNCERHYGIRLTTLDFQIPIWRLVDKLYKSQSR